LSVFHPPSSRSLAIALLLSLATACGGAGETSGDASGPGSGVAVGSGSDAVSSRGDASLAAPPTSPLPRARAVVTRALDSPKSIARAVATADALTDYITAFPDVVDAMAARAHAARLRLLAVGSSAGLQTGPAARALGGDGAQARQLRKAMKDVRALEAAKARVSDVDVAVLGLAVRALLGSDPDEKAIEFDRQKAYQLALGDRPEGMAVRAKWMVRFEKSLRELRTGASELRFFGFARAAGRIICPGCSDAHHVTPDNVTRFLLNVRKNRGGLICDEAFERPLPKGKAPPGQEVERLRACTHAFAVDPRIEDNAWWGANGLALAVMATARTFVEAPVEPTVLEAAVQKRVGALRKALADPVVLPVPAVLGPPPEMLGGKRLSQRTAAVVGLGFGGLTVKAEPLELFAVAPDGFRAGLRTVVGLDKRGTIRSYTSRYSALGRLLRPLAPPEPQRKRRRRARRGSAAAGGDAVQEGIRRIRAAAGRIARKHDLPVSKADDRGAVAEIIVDPEAPATDAIALIETLRTAGYGNFRFLKTAAHGRTFPLVVRSAPKDMIAAVRPGFDRALVAVVRPSYVDIFAPRGRRKGARKTTRRKARLPEEVEAGYRGGNIVRFRIKRKPDYDGVGYDPRVAAKAQQAFRYFERWYGVGPLLHVIAGPGALAADVLRIARTYQERPGKGEIDKPGTFWAGTSCGDESYVANRKQPEGCPTGVVVAFSRHPAPSEGGLKNRFIEKKRKKKKAKKKPSVEAPQSGRCNRGNIHDVMARKKKAFQKCYSKELADNPGLGGQVVLSFTIGSEGRVTIANVSKSTMGNRNVHRCLVKQVRKARFRQPLSGVCQVDWPMAFKMSQ